MKMTLTTKTIRMITDDMCNGCVLTCPDITYDPSNPASTIPMRVESAPTHCPARICCHHHVAFLHTKPYPFRILSPEEIMEMRLAK